MDCYTSGRDYRDNELPWQIIEYIMGRKVIFSNGEEHDWSEIKFFEPTWAFHPGVTLKEKLEEMGMSSSEFAERTGLPLTTIEGVIACKETVTEAMAQAFYVVTKIKPYLWLVAQKDYDAYLLHERQTCEESKVRRASSHEEVEYTPLHPFTTSVGAYA